MRRAAAFVGAYIGLLVAAVTNNAGNAAQVAQDWAKLQAGSIARVTYPIRAGPFAGQSVRIAAKGVEWTPVDINIRGE